MTNSGERLRRSITHRGFPEIADFARRVNKRPGTVRQQINRDHIPAQSADIYARALKVPVEWLLYGRGPDPLEDEPPAPRALSAEPKTIDFEGEAYAAIARYDMQASAGAGRTLAASPAVLHHHLFRMQWLRRVTAAALADLCVIEVIGDSMEPTLRTGDTVLVDRSQRMPSRRDGMYVLNNDGELQVKRVSAHPVTRLFTISSDNPAYKPRDDIPPESIDIVGLVIWVGRRI